MGKTGTAGRLKTGTANGRATGPIVRLQEATISWGAEPPGDADPHSPLPPRRRCFALKAGGEPCPSVGRSVEATRNEGGGKLPKVTCTKTLRLTTTPGKC